MTTSTRFSLVLFVLRLLLLLLTVGLMQATIRDDYICPGDIIRAHADIYSQNGVFRLIVQGDGNVVIYGPNGVVWATGTSASGAYLTLQSNDGNLVLYDGNGAFQWGAGELTCCNVYVMFWNDGNLVKYTTPDMVYLWQSGNPQSGYINDQYNECGLYIKHTESTNPNDDHLDMIFLDRHNNECSSNGVLNSWWVRPSIKIRRECLQIADAYPYLSQTTISDTANSKNLLNFKDISVFCSNNQLMSRWYVQNMGNDNFRVNVVCKSYGYSSLTCNDYYTNYNEANGVSIVYLDRHSISCNKDEGLQGFEGQESNSQLRFRYTCCGINPFSPTSTPTSVPSTSVPTSVPSSSAPTKFACYGAVCEYYQYVQTNYYNTDEVIVSAEDGQDCLDQCTAMGNEYNIAAMPSACILQNSPTFDCICRKGPSSFAELTSYSNESSLYLACYLDHHFNEDFYYIRTNENGDQFRCPRNRDSTLQFQNCVPI